MCVCVCVCVGVCENVPSGYRHNGFAATHALGSMMYGYTLLVTMNQRLLNKLSG